MSDRWRRGDRPTRDPVVRHGRTPTPTTVVAPATGARPGRSRRGTKLPALRLPMPGEKLPLGEPLVPSADGETPRGHVVVRRKLGTGLVPGEKILIAQHRHPVVVVEPILTSLAALLGIAAVTESLGDLNLVRSALMLGWLVLVVRALWRYWEWTFDWFVVTDRRLLRLHGIFDSKRDMMPLSKVTDMAFERPFWGKLVGYGRFVLESAGRDQALREISFVQDPERAYEAICLQIFAKPLAPPSPRRSQWDGRDARSAGRDHDLGDRDTRDLSDRDPRDRDVRAGNPRDRDRHDRDIRTGDPHDRDVRTGSSSDRGPGGGDDDGRRPRRRPDPSR